MNKSTLPMVIAYAVALIGSSSATAMANEDCIPLRFDPGATSTVVRGAAPPIDRRDPTPAGVCYSIDVGEGQIARVRLRSEGNVAVTIPGVGDMRQDFEFRTRRGEYLLQVWQLFPTATEVPFEMHVDVLP